MTTRSALGAAILGSSLLMLCAPANANIFGLTQSAVTTDHDFVIQVAKRGGGGPKAGGAAKAGGAKAGGARAGAAKAGGAVKAGAGAKAGGAVKAGAGAKAGGAASNVNRNVNRNVNLNRGVYTGRHVYTGGRWVRPSNYWWPVGGAVAAGAAIGMITAASAASLAGPAPGPG